MGSYKLTRQALLTVNPPLQLALRQLNQLIQAAGVVFSVNEEALHQGTEAPNAFASKLLEACRKVPGCSEQKKEALENAAQHAIQTYKTYIEKLQSNPGRSATSTGLGFFGRSTTGKVVSVPGAATERATLPSLGNRRLH